MAAATLTERFAMQLSAAAADGERIRVVAAWIFDAFVTFYAEFQRLTWLAKTAFELRDPAAAVAHARTRLGLYDREVNGLADELKRSYPSLIEDEPLWVAVGDAYRERALNRYDGDLATAFLHSVWRRVHLGEWRPVDYTLGDLPRPQLRREDVFMAAECRRRVDSKVRSEERRVGKE